MGSVETRINFKKINKKERYEIMALYFLKKLSIHDISALTGIAPITLYKWRLKHQGEYETLKQGTDEYEIFIKDLEERVVEKIKNATEKIEPTDKKPKTSKKTEAKVEQDSIFEMPISPVEPTNHVSDLIFKQYELISRMFEEQQRHLTHIVHQHELFLSQKNLEIDTSMRKIKELEEENEKLRVLLKDIL